MPDIFSRSKRSWLMAQVLPRHNRSTEIRIICIFKENKITGWRRNYPLFGKPDFVFLKNRVAVFVDGCFWHGCPYHKPLPESNREFWETKIAKNVSRDKCVNRELKRRGWHVIRFWEHELNPRLIKRKLNRLRKLLDT